MQGAGDIGVSLHMCHCLTLILRGIEWEVTEANHDYVLVGHNVPAAIGGDNKAILAAVCDKTSGAINMLEAFAWATKGEGTHAGQIASLLAGSTYHGAASDGDDGLDEEKVYIDLGEDETTAVDQTLQAMVSNTKQKGMSEEVVPKLSQLVQELKPVFHCGWKQPTHPEYRQ